MPTRATLPRAIGPLRRWRAGLEPLDRALHLGLGFFAAHPVGGLDELARLERLVLREEVLDLVQLVLRDVADVLDVVPAVVLGRHAQHLVVAAGLVGHPEHGDRPRLDHHAREHGLRQQHQASSGSPSSPRVSSKKP